MKKMLLTLALCAVAVGAEKQDIALNDGRTLKAARIVTVGEQVTILHAGGSLTVPASSVPLDILARADMELKATAAERQAKAKADAKRAEEVSAAMKKAKEEELAPRLAMANMREQATGGTEFVPVTTPRRSIAEVEKELAALKNSLPRHPNSGSQDPLIRDCVSKYTRAFSQIQPNTIGQNAKWIRDNIARDTAACQQTLATTFQSSRGSQTATSSMRASARENMNWMNALGSALSRIEGLVQ